MAKGRCPKMPLRPLCPLQSPSLRSSIYHLCRLHYHHLLLRGAISRPEAVQGTTVHARVLNNILKCACASMDVLQWKQNVIPL